MSHELTGKTLVVVRKTREVMGCGKAGVRSNRKKFELVLVARGLEGCTIKEKT